VLDGAAKSIIQPTLDRIGRGLAGWGISANHVTLVGLLIGVFAGAAIVAEQFFAALVLILVSRALDGLDGAVARAMAPSDFGGFLDIVLDFAFYGLIPLAFIIQDPQQNGIAGGLLLLSFYVNGASFLAFATIAQKRGLSTEARGVKSFYFTTGLAEAAETLLVFLAFCLLPGYFAWIAIFFAILCFYTALSRIVEARSLFADRD
jgi:phosphatidylglycerophosphate synthase